MISRSIKILTFLCIFVGIFSVFNFAQPTVTYAYDGEAPAAPTDPAPAQVDPVTTCTGLWCGHSWYYVLFDWVVSGIGALVAIIGMALDYSIDNFIIGFGEKYQSSNLGETINSMWGLVRDVFNLTFIFGLVYIGFKMILDSGDSHIRKSLVSLIGAALLVNFSLFITKFIVDFSNIAAFKVYEAFQSADGGSASISVAFANVLGMSSIFQNGGLGASESGSLLYLLGTLIVLLVLAYVYLAAAILITIRFVTLSIYLVFSPVMFLGWVFPSMGSATKKYWEGFLGQAFFAPAFLFMLYLSYRVVYRYNDDVYKEFGNGGYFNAYEQHGAWAQSDSLIPFFAMTIVFLIASMVVARKMSSQGSESMIKLSKYMEGKARGAINGTANAAAYLPRTGARWAVNKGGEGAEKRLNQLQARGGFWGGVASTNAADRLLRGGAQKAVKAKLGTGTTNKEEKAYKTATTTRINQTQTDAENKKKIAAGLASGATADEIAAMQSVVAGMSNSQLEEMKDADRINIAGYLTSAQAENLMKSDKLGGDKKAAVAAERKRIISNLIQNNAGIITTELAKLSVEQLETMGDEFIRTNAHLLTHGQMEDLKKSKKFTEIQRDRFATVRKDTHTNSLANTAPAGAERMLFRHSNGTHRKAVDISNLGRDVLLNSKTLQYLTPDVLEAIADKKTLSSSDRATLKRTIMTGSRTGQNAVLQGWFTSPEGIHMWK